MPLPSRIRNAGDPRPYSMMLIDYYQAIEASSQQMLAAAMARDWDGVVRCEGACAVLIEQLRLRAQTEKLTPEHFAEKSRIMKRILINDAQVRCLTEEWLDEGSPHIPESPRVLH